MHLKASYISKLIWLPLSLLLGCQLQGKGPTDPDKKDVTIRDLYRAARAQQMVLLVDGWDKPQYGDSLRHLVANFYHPDWQLQVKHASQVSSEELSSVPVLLLGTPENNPWIALLADDLPFVFHKATVAIGSRDFDMNRHVLALGYYPNPLNVKMPVGLFSSEDESQLWELANQRITSFFRGNWNYEIVASGRNVLLGNFSQDPENRWEFDQQQELVLPLNIVHRWQAGPFAYHSYHPEINASNAAHLVNTCRQEATKISQLTGMELPNNSIDYYLYPTTEVKGLMTGNTDQSHLDFDRGQVHTALDLHVFDRYPGKENQLMLRTLLGKPSYHLFEEGLSLHLNPDWQKRGTTFWSRHLFAGGYRLSFQQLLDPAGYEGMSSLVRESFSGSLVGFLLEHWGQQRFLEHYRYWEPTDRELDQLTAKWWSWLSSMEKVPTATGKKPLEYWQGVNFTHEGYRIYNGYGSLLSAKSLEMVADLGANSVAIVPYSWMKDPKSPHVFRFSQRPGSENDEGVIHAIRNAQLQGLQTMLKPHVWIRGSWPGEVDMASASDWDQFFDYYYQWISHYALMAEMYQVDAFCIGVEFSKATLGQEQRWRELINKIRGIYSGNLTYAANWGEEFENIRFWDELDLIGLNCYYPLSREMSPTTKDLEEGFLDVLKRVEQVKSTYNKPVVFTEIGFRSVTAPWIQPHEEAGEKAQNQAHQAMCYQAVFRAMSAKPVADGILWWKWPTNPGTETGNDRRFVPAGKRAEQVISQWFSQKK